MWRVIRHCAHVRRSNKRRVSPAATASLPSHRLPTTMDGARKPNLKRRLSEESHSSSKRPTTCSIKPTDPATKPRASFNYLPEELISQTISYLSIEEFKHYDAQSTP